ncbi:MAG: phosphotransferase family protein [Pseudomonadota bacterium]
MDHDQRSRLAAHMVKIGLPLGDAPFTRFSGGLANQNYLLEAGGRSLVLRRPPDGELPPGAHNMAREYAVLSRLHRAFPLAPEAVHLCEDVSVLGVPFQLITYVPGLVIKGDHHLLLEDPAQAAAVSAMLVETLVALHEVDAEQIGLGDLGRPEGFAARAVEGWGKRAQRLLEADGPADVIGDADGNPDRDATARLSDEIGAWLRAASLRQREPTLLHCDFKLDNMILDPLSLRPVAVVDWDMGTRGDPMFDLATLLSYWSQPGDPPARLQLAQMPSVMPGFATRDAVVQAYARARGVEVDDYPVFAVLAMYKLAVVFLQLHALYARGATDDPRYAAFKALGQELMVVAHDLRAEAR